MATVAELEVLIDAEDKATPNLLALGALIDSFDKKALDIIAKANTAAAQAGLQGLKDSLDDINETSLKPAERSVQSFGSTLRRLGSEATQASRSVRGIATAAVATAPILATIGTVGVAGLGAFAAAGTSAGIGIGLFGVIAKSVYSEVQDAVSQITKAEQALKEAVTDKQREAALQKIEMAYKALTPAQAAATRAQLAFGEAWDKFAARYEPAIFQMIADGFNGIAATLPRLTPMMDGVTSALQRLEARAITALQGPFWQQFFDYLARTAGPAVEGFGLTLGNLAKGFAGLLIAFEPLTTAFINGMVQMSEKFAAWATSLETNQGFQKFVDYVIANTPVVLATIGELGRLFINLVEALMPVGAVALPMIRDFLAALNRFADAHPHITTVATSFAVLVAIVMTLAAPLVAIWTAMKLLAAPLMAVARWLGIIAPAAVATGTGTAAAAVGVRALALGFASLGLAVWGAVTHFDTFIQDLRMVVGAIGNVYAAVEQLHTTLSGKLRAALGMGELPMKEAGRNWMQRFGEGGNEGTPAAVAPFDALAPRAQSSISLLEPYMSQAGRAGMVGLGGAAQGALPEAVAPFGQIPPSALAFLDTLPPEMRAEAEAAMAQFGLGGAAGVPGGVAPFGTLPPEVMAAVGDTSNLLNPHGNKAATSFGHGYQLAMLGVLATVRSGMQGVNQIVTVEMATMATNARVGVEQFAAAIRGGMGAAMQAGNMLANAAVQGASTAGYRMSAAGASAGSSFAAGVRSQAGAVAAAGRALANAAARSMPGSPAKEGPLSGKGYTLLRGQRFGEDLARGIRSRVGLVAATSNQAALAMASNLGRTDFQLGASVATKSTRHRAASAASSTPAIAGGGINMNITNYNPIAEPTSVSTNKGLQRIAALGLI